MAVCWSCVEGSHDIGIIVRRDEISLLMLNQFNGKLSTMALVIFWELFAVGWHIVIYPIRSDLHRERWMRCETRVSRVKSHEFPNPMSVIDIVPSPTCWEYEHSWLNIKTNSAAWKVSTGDSDNCDKDAFIRHAFLDMAGASRYVWLDPAASCIEWPSGASLSSWILTDGECSRTIVCVALFSKL